MITSSLSCRNLVNFYLLKRSSPLLRLQTLRRLNSVFSRAAREAELEPGNARKQAEYFKQLYDKRDYSKIIQRFEENADKLALDSNSIRIYVEALNRTGQGNRALEHVFKGVQARQDFMPSGHYGELKEGRSNEQLLQRILKIAEQNGRDRSVMSEPLIEPPHASNQGTKENPVYVVSRNPPLSNKDRFWSAIKLTAGIWFALAVYATFSEEISRMNGGRSFSVMKENVPEAPSHFTFADVQGVDEAKEELLEIVEFLKDPHKFTKLGGKLPKGVLLTGPPGTGKTLLARAVAGEASVPFFLCSGSEFDEMFVGVGAKRVRELFAAAKKNSPCIVFIDEIDAVGSMRNPRDQQYAKMTLNQLLVEMDGFSQTEGIIVIGATNFPESLDKALVRPGRFDRNVTVSLPDVKGRQEILKVHTKNVPLANDVRLGLIARATPGFSGADLFNLINYAAVRAASFDQNNVTMTDLEWARDRILMGAERKSAAISERSKRLTAFHESGHAIMAVYTPGATPIHKATIMPRGQALGMVSQVPDDDEFEWNKKQMLARIDVAMGGRVAEELIFGQDDITSGASSDIEQATKIAKAMISRFGMGSDQVGKVLWEKDYEELSSETRQKIENEVRKTIEDSYLRAKTLLTKKRKELDLLANALLEYETLSKDEIEKVIKGLKLDRPIVSDKE